jgi:nucleoid-associated protein YgaU
VVVPDEPLPSGSGALSIETKTDANAPAMQSEQIVAIIVPEQGKDDALVAVMSPDAPTKVLQKPEPEPEPAAAAETEVAAAPPRAGNGSEETPAPAAKPRMISLDAVDYDAEGNIVFSGKGTPGHVARIYVDNDLTGEAVIGADGRWMFSGTTAVTPGVHALRVDGVDSAGKVASRIEVPFFREETTKVATATPDQVVPKSDAGEAEPAAAVSDAAGATAEAAPAAEQAAKPTEGRLVIQPGNNLWRISKVIYGDGLKYATLYQANKDQIRDPDLIYPGQVFRTPDVLPPETIDPTQRDPMTATESSAVVQ